MDSKVFWDRFSLDPPKASISKLRIRRSPIYIGSNLLNFWISCRSPQSAKISEAKSHIQNAITDRNLHPLSKSVTRQLQEGVLGKRVGDNTYKGLLVAKIDG